MAIASFYNVAAVSSWVGQQLHRCPTIVATRPCHREYMNCIFIKLCIKCKLSYNPHLTRNSCSSSVHGNIFMKNTAKPLIYFSVLLLGQSPVVSAEAGFSQHLKLNGISFDVECPNAGSLNKLTIRPSGLKTDNTLITRDIDGTVVKAAVEDLNADGSPEIYVFITSAGSGSYGSVVAYGANRKKSLTEIYMPPLEENKAAMKGYMGHDEFELVEGRLVRSFPIYEPKDSNAKPSGGTRQVQYKLVAGEAGWLLKPYRTFEIPEAKSPK